MGELLSHWLAMKEAEIAEQPKLKGKRLIPGKKRPGPTHPFKHPDWTSSVCVVAGDWMLRVAEWLPCFAKDEYGRPCIAPEWQPHIDKICEHLESRHPVMLPHRSPPKPWTGWWSNYSDRLRASFVRDWRPETRKAIEATFAAAGGVAEPEPTIDDLEVQRAVDALDASQKPRPPAEPLGSFAELAVLKYSLPFLHADGVNALKAVPLRINQSLLPLSDKFAVELMGHDSDKRKADRRTVKADLRHARWCGDETIYLDYNCDKRGRLNAIQRLNYAREDHVRSLFEFAHPAPLTADGKDGREAMQWLEIHCANCWGEDKKPWHDRVRWSNENADFIKRVAADPQGILEHWCKADKKPDKPFAFVAACMELSRARKDPSGFETHLPTGFDGAANGLQHLALLARDEKAARLVNLINSDDPQDIYPQDIYLAVTQRVMKLLEGEDDRLRVKGKRYTGCFEWWRKRLKRLTEKQKRKLFKGPVMTFPYSATVGKTADEIVKAHAELFPNRTWPTPEAATFLAMAVRLACQDVLPLPCGIMKYIRALALHRFKQGQFLEWRSLSGFPIVNSYHYPRIVPLDLCFGIRSRYKPADGATSKVKKHKMLNAASPNFVHSLDAAHLICTVLAANSGGIRDILTVHDSYSCLAPFARRFGQIIRREMAMLHVLDPLRALSKANGDPLPLPKRGNLDPLALEKGEYSFM
jgi:DNA-directed RNA polymerase